MTTGHVPSRWHSDYDPATGTNAKNVRVGDGWVTGTQVFERRKDKTWELVAECNCSLTDHTAFRHGPECPWRQAIAR